MKICLTDYNLPKLCHAKAGDVIRIPGDLALYLVCRHDIGKKQRPKIAGNGLYSEENPMFMVNLETGEASALPHYSSRVEIVRDVAVCKIEGS
jgi:hypothetical protein